MSRSEEVRPALAGWRLVEVEVKNRKNKRVTGNKVTFVFFLGRKIIFLLEVGDSRG